MATEPNSLPISASESEVNQDNSNCKVCIRKMMTDLILWQNWRKSVLVFVILQALIYDFTYKSALSVVSVSGQIVLWITIGYRIYVRCQQLLNRTQIQGNPFQEYLDMDLSITPKQSQQLACFISTMISGFLTNLRSIAFMESPFESIKWMGILSGMSFVGHFFYVSTLLRLGLLLLFTIPKIYKWQQPLIDDLLETLQQCLPCFRFEKATEMKTNSKILVDLDETTLEQCDMTIGEKTLANPQNTCLSSDAKITEELCAGGDKTIGEKTLANPQDTCLSSDAKITEKLCAGGDDINILKMEEETSVVDDFEQIGECWKDEDINDFMIRKNR